MAKLSKQEIKLHNQACDLLKKDFLNWDDRYFVLENWQESATHVNSAAGAFFTPPALARDFALEAGGTRIIDLCAGIGSLSFAIWSRYTWEEQKPEIVCVEINPAYVEVGKKILPEATWICGSIFDLPRDIGHFDTAISNPPFGRIKTDGMAPRYTGADFEYKVIDIASDLADSGAFIIPQMSAPFCYSGRNYLQDSNSEKAAAFTEKTKINMGMNLGIDTAYHKDDWKGASPICEIVICDFEEARALRQPRTVASNPSTPQAQLNLF